MKGKKINHDNNANANIFYYSMLFIPLLHFCVFYIYANFDSFYMAFTEYDYAAGSFKFVGFKTYNELFYKFETVGYYWGSIKNSLLLMGFNLLIGIPLPIIFSNYLFKRSYGSGFFKVTLFLPTMISSIVLVTIFKNCVEYALPALGDVLGTTIAPDLIANPDKAKWVVLFYSLWLGFGSQIILYTGAMSAISVSILEAAELDGAGRVRELWSVVLPSIWPTIITFTVTTLSGTFNGMMHLYDFYGGAASEDVMTMGYYLFKKINSKSTTFRDYPELSAIGLMCTGITCCVVLVIKHLMEKVGPSED